MVKNRESMKTDAQRYGNVYYVIDEEMAEEEGRTLETLLLSRRCSSCRAQMGEKKSITPAKKQMGEIAKCCAKVEDFLSPGMPLRELVFRLLLKGGNKPKSINDLHYALTEDLAWPTHPMNISVDALKRILDLDEYYSFKEVIKERGSRETSR